MLAALGYRFEVLFHDIDGVVDLLLMERSVSDGVHFGGVRRVNEALIEWVARYIAAAFGNEDGLCWC